MADHLDPLGRERPEQPELDPAFHGLTGEDMAQRYSTSSIKGPEVLTGHEIVERSLSE